MTKKLFFVSAIVLALALVAVSADSVTGKWTYDQPAFGRGGGGGGGGNMPPRVVTMDLKAEGEKLTGTVLMPAFGRRGGGGGGEAPPAPTPIQITNGKVSGNDVSFEVTRDFGGNSMTTKYAGTVSGSEMKLKITSPGFQGGEDRVNEVTAKKQ